MLNAKSILSLSIFIIFKLIYTVSTFSRTRQIRGKLIEIKEVITPYGRSEVKRQYIPCPYLNPQIFFIACTSISSTCFSMSSGRLQKKSMPVRSSRVLMLTT